MTDPPLSHNTDKGRFYTHPKHGKSVPSITNVKDVKAIPGLKFWAARMAAEYTADNLEKLAGLERDEIIQLVKNSPFAGRGKKQQASKVGDIVHDWIDQVAKGGTVNPLVYVDKDGIEHESPRQARQMWRQFAGPDDKCFLEMRKPRWVMSEFTVWSDAHNYAGTGDWIAYIGNLLVLGDNKTGERIYPDTAFQLAALANADFILDVDGTEHPLPKVDAYAVLHIRPTFWRLWRANKEAVDAYWRGFVGLKDAFDCVNNYEDKVYEYSPKVEVRAA